MSPTSVIHGLNLFWRNKFNVRSGVVDANDSKSTRYLGKNGYNWSKAPYTDDNYAYVLGTYSDGVYPSNRFYGRLAGFPLRCLAS